MPLPKDKQDIIDAYCAKVYEKGRADNEKQTEVQSMMEALGPLLTEAVLDAALAKARAEGQG